MPTRSTVTSPFFSPSGEWVGYLRDGQLQKIATSGGAPVTLGQTGTLFGASWGDDDVIVYGQASSGIWQLPGGGGAPELLVAVGEGESAQGPQMLPGGEWVLFTLRPEGRGEWDDARIVVQSLTTGERRVVVERGRDARYLPTGHLVYLLNAVLFGVPFDPAAPAATGGAVPLVQGVRPSFGASSTGAAHFSVADTGALVYIPGSESVGDFELVWLDREGRAQPVGAEPRTYRWARVSPNGSRVAVHTLGDGNADVWIYELERRTFTRFTFDEGFDGFPLWSPDGSHVVFQSSRDGGGLFWKASDGTGEVERLLESPNAPRPDGWSSDGRLVFSERAVVGIVNLEGDGSWELLLKAGRSPSISPDGHWIAYSSRESLPNQIFVRPFPNVNDARWQVSVDYGFDPVWSPDGRELFYNTREGLMMVQIETEPTFNNGPPELLPVNPGTPVNGTEFDIAPDGDRFLILSALEERTDDEGLVYVQNWHEELKRLVPAKR